MPLPFSPRRGTALSGAALLSMLAAAPCRAADSDGAPSPPADAPPAPALLAPDARATEPATAATFEATAEGRWRIRFAAGREELSENATSRIEDLGRRLANGANTGRVMVEAQSSGPETDISAARRLSLGRALAVKAALASGGLPPTRIDLRPLGRTAEAADVADILPPPAPAARRTGTK